ncbi:MAG TPA: hypothetical protein VMG35_03770 [Bryobacteraceae bacterium]|nr:hypothetical protein [Bryobacteraceae bacterium]
MKNPMLYGFARAAAALLLAAPANLQAQRGGRAAQTPQEAAPVDLTGYWVSVVTEDWRYRMMTPAKGDYPSIPLNPEGRKIAAAWDPARDEAAGEQCKGYGAGAIMRLPGRIHITWQDANTLKVETDTGQQTRLFHFVRPGPAPPDSEAPSWQGYSAAQWEYPGGRGARGSEAQGGSLKVVTTHLKPGYLQKNGVPYGAGAVVTEHFDALNPEANSDQWLLITTLVDDPQYLARPFQRSTHFKRLPGAQGWDPQPCSAK